MIDKSGEVYRKGAVDMKEVKVKCSICKGISKQKGIYYEKQIGQIYEEWNLGFAKDAQINLVQVCPECGFSYPDIREEIMLPEKKKYLKSKEYLFPLGEDAKEDDRVLAMIRAALIMKKQRCYRLSLHYFVLSLYGMKQQDSAETMQLRLQIIEMVDRHLKFEKAQNFGMFLMYIEQMRCLSFFKMAIETACEKKYKVTGIDRVLLDHEIRLCKQKCDVPYSFQEILMMNFEEEE